MPSPHSKARRTRDTTTIKRASHQKSTRVQEAAAQVQEDQRRLHARIAYEQAQEALAAALGATAAPQDYELERAKKELAYQAGQEALRERYPYGEARDLVRQGYSATHVQRRTGWPAGMLADVIAGEW